MRDFLYVFDFTKLFKKERLLYSLFDKSFKTPIQLMYGVYFLILTLFISVPLLLIFGIKFKILVMFAIGLPFVGAKLLSSPIWGGKSFASFLKVQLKFIFNPKHYYDLRAIKGTGDYLIHNEILVSRRNDYYELYKISKEELEND